MSHASVSWINWKITNQSNEGGQTKIVNQDLLIQEN